MYTKRHLIALLACLWLGSSVFAQEARSHLAEVLERGKLVMLCFPHLEGSFARPNLERGPTRRVGTAEDFEGIDVELMRRFAAELGVELEVRTLETPGYGPLIPALLEGEADLVASSLTITEARDEVVDFSTPYFEVYKVLVARKDSGIRGPADLAGKRAVVIPGSSHQEALEALGVSTERMHPVEFTSEYFTAVADGDADFALVDSTTARRSLDLLTELEVVHRLPGADHYGVALPPGSDLREPLDRFLTELEASGELERIVRAEMGSS